MSMFAKLKKKGPLGPPENAHGQRNIDGSYFSVWQCQYGHGEIGKVDEPPEEVRCMGCTMDLTEREAPVWTRCTREEAHDFIFKIEGFDMYNGVGFRML